MKLRVTVVFSTMALACTAAAQNYPNKPVRVLTAEVGGTADIVSRLIAPILSASLGQQVVVDNRGALAPDIGARANADGYTITAFGNGLWITPLMQQVPYDPLRDFAPVTLAQTSPNMLVVHPSVPVKSVQELIALAKAKPGELNYSSSTNGSTPHLAGELFKSMAGVNIVRIPYKGAAPAMNALIAGQVQVMFPAAASAAPHMEAGRLRALGVTSARPFPLFPDLPTVAAAGVPGYESGQILGVFVPAKTAPAIVALLHREIVRVLSRSEIKEKFLSLGVEAVGSTPGELHDAMQSEMSKMGKILKASGISTN